MQYATTVKHLSVAFEGNPGDIVIDALNLKEENEDGDTEKIGPSAVRTYHHSGVLPEIIKKIDIVCDEELKASSWRVPAESGSALRVWSHIWAMQSRTLAEHSYKQ